MLVCMSVASTRSSPLATLNRAPLMMASAGFDGATDLTSLLIVVSASAGMMTFI